MRHPTYLQSTVGLFCGLSVRVGCRSGLARAPGHHVHVADGVDHKQHRHRGHRQEVEGAVQDTDELLYEDRTMKYRRIDSSYENKVCYAKLFFVV
ncbi:hypothetical protein DPMN_128639 [Dreissena polymorpha]|uniref:Uncharacterized protein n=1 Tax=Dreissena polymorpha TaxID=45954 RepID=A0A9D4JXM0_DREPO|nr:hypothetical protein DPMN_128639 [Dreissena polymorpha]